ncbi:MAG: acyl-CoA dehydrogenase [Burkholderiaceae bacterium]|nr:acyl-CoA dehydrogenase [Burkholderiaceae bacterium]
MHFDYDEEQRALQETLGRFLAREYDSAKRRARMASEEGFSRQIWARFAELGILGAPFPEDLVGRRGSAVDTMLVMELLGRALAVEPYLPTVVLCGSLLCDAGNEAQRALAGSIATGQLLMALAHHEPGTRHELPRVATRSRERGNGYVLNGLKSIVLGGPAADKLIVSARTQGSVRDEHGISLFLVDRSAPGLSLRSCPTHDGSHVAEVELADVHVPEQALLGPRDHALPRIERAIDRAIAALCAEAVGIMEALNEETLVYLKMRRQFGQPLADFQALRHRLVDMVVATEQARSMAILASIRADSPDAAERRRAVSAAKAYVGQAAHRVGQEAVQLHGGMGVVDELDVSHRFKRLTMIDATFGDADHHLGAFSDRLVAA